MANVISVQENSYTSQLNVTVIPQTVGKTIRCLYNDGLSVTTLNTSLIIHTIGLICYLIPYLFKRSCTPNNSHPRIASTPGAQ